MPHSFGLVAAVGHPHEATQCRMPVTGKCKTAVAIYPSVRMRSAPGRFFVEATQTVGYDALVFLLLMPERPFGPVHHLISTDDVIIAPVQETFEK